MNKSIVGTYTEQLALVVHGYNLNNISKGKS